MGKYTMSAGIVAFLLFFFWWGVSQKETAVRAVVEKECEEAKTVEIIKEVEVIKYVTKEKAKIYSKPNATRSELLSLMHNSKL